MNLLVAMMAFFSFSYLHFLEQNQLIYLECVMLVFLVFVFACAAYESNVEIRRNGDDFDFRIYALNTFKLWILVQLIVWTYYVGSGSGKLASHVFYTLNLECDVIVLARISASCLTLYKRRYRCR